MLDKTKRYLVVGLGLLGGKYALELTKAGFHVDGINRSEGHLQYALDQGYIARGKTFPDKTGICHGFMAINPAAFGDPDAIRKHFSEYLEALRESPKADGQDRIYTHGEKEVAAEKDRKENGIPVNDNTMVELADLCSYLKLDFGSYFEGYELPKDSKFFNGNY